MRWVHYRPSSPTKTLLSSMTYQLGAKSPPLLWNSQSGVFYQYGGRQTEGKFIMTHLLVKSNTTDLTQLVDTDIHSNFSSFSLLLVSTWFEHEYFSSFSSSSLSSLPSSSPLHFPPLDPHAHWSTCSSSSSPSLPSVEQMC